MARSKKPRKPYKPPACRVQQLVKGCLSLERTVAGVQPYTNARKAEIAITHRLELQRICTGKGTLEDLDQLCIVYSATVVMAERIGRECVAVVLAATDALMDARARYKRTGRIGLDGAGIQRVRDMLDLYEELLEHITPEQYRQAIRQVWARIQRGDVIPEKTAETTANNRTEPATCSTN